MHPFFKITMPAAQRHWPSLLASVLASANILAADANSAAPSRQLVLGETKTGLYGAEQSVAYFELSAPTGLACLTIAVGGGKGDVDLYLRQAVKPTLEQYDYRPYVWGNAEQIEITAPTNGVWLVMLHGYAAYTDVWLRATGVMEHSAPPPGQAAVYSDMELALYYELCGAPTQTNAGTAVLRNYALRDEGRAAYNAGNYSNAIAVWRQWHADDPADPEPLALIGDVHLRLGDITNAAAYYRQSLDIYPGQFALAARLARLLDTAAGRPDEARALLNYYGRLFPGQPVITLAQAEWLVRHQHYTEARDLVQSVLAACQDTRAPENLRALALLHGLLLSPAERFTNLRAMLAAGARAGMETQLAWDILDYHLHTYPESWLLVNFAAAAAKCAAGPEKQALFARLLPRSSAVSEDFSVKRMSKEWIASKEENIYENGRITLSTDLSQTETSLRLLRSDSLSCGFIEALVEKTRGSFWLYGRRSPRSSIRFGFDENGYLYLQCWMDGQLVRNERRVGRAPGELTRLRLEVRGDGAFGYVNNMPAFSAPLGIPRDAGPGWWGLAPWAPQPGAAQATVRQLSAGPLPVMIGVLASGWPTTNAAELAAGLKSYLPALSALAPVWYKQDPDGAVICTMPADTTTYLRMFCHYHQARLLPVIQVQDHRLLALAQLNALAAAARTDGFILEVNRMPEPEWIDTWEENNLDAGLTLELMLIDKHKAEAQIREICPYVGLFPAPRQTRIIPIFDRQTCPPAVTTRPLDQNLSSAVLTL